MLNSNGPHWWRKNILDFTLGMWNFYGYGGATLRVLGGGGGEGGEDALTSFHKTILKQNEKNK